MVEHVFNPESVLLEQLETATVEAVRLRQKLAELTDEDDRKIIRRQLEETEQTIAALQRRLRG